MATTRMSCRRPPLHTCAVSLMEIADKTYTKAQDFNGISLGSITKKIARLASLSSPLVYALEYQLLLIFSFLDNWIFAFESAVEAIFPPSRYAFDKIDEFVQVAEILPGKFDEAVNKFPVMIHQVPFLDWALFRAISCLNFFISKLREWGSGNAKEKEIPIDMNYNESTIIQEEAEQRIESQNPDDGNAIMEDFDHISVSEGTFCSKIMKETYKDALKKGRKEKGNGDKDGGGTAYKNVLKKGTKGEEENENRDKEEMKYEDALEKRAKENNEDRENGDRNEGKTLKKKEKKENSKKETKDFGVSKEVNGEEGKIKNIEKKENSTEEEKERKQEEKANEETEKSSGSEEVNGKETDKTEENSGKGYWILELFESTWPIKPEKRDEQSSFSHRLSYKW